MGSACCVAARDRTLGSEYSHRNIRYSPSLSFRWDSRARSEDNLENPTRFSCLNSLSADLEVNCGLETDIEAISDGKSPVRGLQRLKWQKSSISAGSSTEFRRSTSDLSMGRNAFNEENFESAATSSSSSKLPVSVPSTSSTSMAKGNPLSSQTNSHPSDRTPLMRSHRSPGCLLSRQVSDSRISKLKFQNNNLESEGRRSFVLSLCSNDSTSGSRDGSSDGWSMRTFTELVASSQRRRWSFDSENMSSSNGNVSRCNSELLNSQSVDLQMCEICSKLLTERSIWSSQKFLANNELSVVAVLVCGHAYHAECLENITTETDKYDPSCPICVAGEKITSKMSRKASRGDIESKARNKISWIGVADIDSASETISDHRKSTGEEGKGPEMRTGTSMRSSFGRPFLRGNFSIGSRSIRSQPENESTRRKVFWARYRK